MNFKLNIVTLLLIFVSTVYSQNKSSVNKFEPIERLIFLDSVKKTFTIHKSTSRIDSLWLKELSNKELFETIETDVATLDINATVNYDLPTDLLKSRLKEMDAKSPFNIEWNQGLENTIKQFLKNRKKSFERLMAISEYYFPQFEEALAKENVPLEIKYLAVVESALNPRAISKMGATGLWQFMFHTAKNYGLNIDSYVDERSDPLLASKAASQYMSKMYKIFGDWDLVLASYNSGPGNVTKAIRRANGEQNYWKIRKFLPKETQNYVPAFLATMYIYEYHTSHGISPRKAPIKHFETDTIMVKQQLSFKQISDLMNVPIAQLQFMNPQYKTDVIPFYKNINHYLRMPADKIAVFASNEAKVYAYANYETYRKEKLIIERQKITRLSDSIAKVVALNRKNNLNKNTSVANVKTSSATIDGTIAKMEATTDKNDLALSEENQTHENQFYTVQAGDNLGKISQKFKVTEADLKLWNGLENTTIALHSKLRIAKNIVGTEIETNASKINIIATHVVKKGENIWNIAEQYNLTAAVLKERNNLKSNEIKVGLRLFLNENNNQNPTKSIIVKKEFKSKKPMQYAVLKGDTLIEIADKFPGVSVADLRKWNKIKDHELRIGMKLKING